jgi:signal peptidase II
VAELFGALVVVLALDQLSKALVVRRLGEGQTAPASPAAPLRIHRVGNTRPGLARLRVGSGALILVWIVLLGATWLPTFAGPLARLGLGLALGGAAGNLLDRLRHGAVIDFIDIRVWPLFNLADLMIVLGLGLALAGARVAG